MNPILRLCRRGHDDSGIAMVTAVLVTAIVFTLTIGSFELAIHNTTGSAYDRDRTQAIHAANAGIDQMVAYFKSATGAQVCSPPSAASSGQLTNASGSTIAGFTVKTTVTGGVCPYSPTQVQIASTGYATAAAGVVRSTREMEALVNVKSSVFDHAMFHGSSTQTLVLGNKTDGNLFLDADVYSNADVQASNNITISGDLTSQRTVSLSGSAIVKGTVWAAGSVQMANSAFVASNVVASTKTVPVCTTCVPTTDPYPGQIRMSNNSRIAGNARAAGAITAATIDGTQTANSPSSPPPMEALPTFTWNAALNWPAPVNQFNACNGANGFTTWFTSNISALLGASRISATNCTFAPANNAVMTLTGNLAVINYSDINFNQQTTWHCSVQVCNLWLISTNGNISFGQNTNFDSNVHVFLYTPNTATVANQNSWYGQVYAGVINATNQFTLEYVNAFPPGFSSSTNTGYGVDTVYIREIVPN